MSENGTRAIVRELYDAYGRRDFERVAALIHDDIDWIIYAPMSVFPFAGPRHGRAAVLAAMATIAKTFALESYQPDVMIVDGSAPPTACCGCGSPASCAGRTAA